MIFTSTFAKVADIKRESKIRFIIAARVGRDTPSLGHQAHFSIEGDTVFGSGLIMSLFVKLKQLWHFNISQC